MNLIDICTKFLKEIANYDLRTLSYLTEQLVERWGLDIEEELDPALAEYYSNKVVPHKAAVFKAGWETLNGVQKERPGYWFKRLLFHDLSKFSKAESAYAFHNFKDKSANSPEQIEAFELAWHHHKLNNSHHPEHWWKVNRDGSTEVLPMPHDDVVEMVADWIGAGKTYGNTLESWLTDPKAGNGLGNLATFVFHEKTIASLQPLLELVTGLESQPSIYLVNGITRGYRMFAKKKS